MAPRAGRGSSSSAAALLYAPQRRVRRMARAAEARHAIRSTSRASPIGRFPRCRASSPRWTSPRNRWRCCSRRSRSTALRLSQGAREAAGRARCCRASSSTTTSTTRDPPFATAHRSRTSACSPRWACRPGGACSPAARWRGNCDERPRAGRARRPLLRLETTFTHDFPESNRTLRVGDAIDPRRHVGTQRLFRRRAVRHQLRAYAGIHLPAAAVAEGRVRGAVHGGALRERCAAPGFERADRTVRDRQLSHR